MTVVIGGTHHLVRGASFSVDILAAAHPAGPGVDPFTPSGRATARSLTARIEREIAGLLPERTRQADATAPSRERWSWLGRLFS